MPCYLRRIKFFVALALLEFISLPSLFADGGAVQFRQQAGALVVTLFASPSPLRTGSADLSVLLETASGNEPVLDATVTLSLRHGDAERTVAATHVQATNKLLYAALPDLPESGPWQVTVTIARGQMHSEISGTIEVLPGPPALLFYWPYFLVAPLAMVLFVLNQRLKKREAARRQRTGSPAKHYHLSKSGQPVRSKSQSPL